MTFRQRFIIIASSISDDELKDLLNETTADAPEPLYLTVGEWLIRSSLSFNAKELKCRTLNQRTAKLIRRFNALEPIRTFRVLIRYTGGRKGKRKKKPSLHVFVCRSYRVTPGVRGVRSLLPKRECNFYKHTTSSVISRFFGEDGELSSAVESLIKTKGIPDDGTDLPSFYDKDRKGTFVGLYATYVKLDKNGMATLESLIIQFLKNHYYGK